MAINMQEKIEEIVHAIQEDDSLLENFKKDPKAVVTKFAGVVLTQDVVEALVDGVKAKIKLDSLGDALGGLGKLFGK